jgi:hypothetical protein
MNLESRLTDALRAAGTEGTPTAAGREAMLAEAATRRNRRMRATTALAVAASVVVALGAFAVLRDDPTSQVRTVPPVDVPSTDVPRTTLAPTTTTTPPPAARPATAVAVTPKGALVVVDTTTGRTVRTLAREPQARSPHKPALSPDGSTAYFTRQGVDCGYSTLYRVPVDGSAPPTRLGNGSVPAVSHDGTKLAFATPSNGCVGAILVVRDLGTGREQRWPAPENDGYYSNGAITAIAWAPDGRRLAFQFDNEGSGVYLLDTTVPGRLDAAKQLNPLRQPAHTALALRDWPSAHRLLVSALCCLHPDGMTAVEVRTTTRTLDVHPETLESSELFLPGEAAHSLDSDRSGEWLLWVGDDRILRYRGPDGLERPVGPAFAAATW